MAACSGVTAVTDDRSVVIRWRKSETSGQTGQSGVKHVTTQSERHHVIPSDCQQTGNTGYHQWNMRPQLGICIEERRGEVDILSVDILESDVTRRPDIRRKNRWNVATRRWILNWICLGVCSCSSCCYKLTKWLTVLPGRGLSLLSRLTGGELELEFILPLSDNSLTTLHTPHSTLLPLVITMESGEWRHHNCPVLFVSKMTCIMWGNSCGG